MKSLASIPQEIIFEILRNLPLRTIELVALTFIHPITEICISLLQRLFEARKIAKRLTERFRPVTEAPITNIMSSTMLKLLRAKKHRRLLDLSPRNILKWPSGFEDWTPDLDYLDLCGDFEWLQPLRPGLADVTSLHWRGPASDESKYGDLIASAECVGVRLPPAFLKFIQEPELQKRIPSMNAAAFWLDEHGLKKIQKSCDGGAGGYLIQFLADQHGSYVIHLYLEPGEHGGHCILLSRDIYTGENHDGLEDTWLATITDEERREAEELGVRVAVLHAEDEFRLIGLDFEEWLARMYYEESLWFLLYHANDDEKSPTEGLEQYVKTNYVSSTLDYDPVEDSDEDSDSE